MQMVFAQKFFKYLTTRQNEDSNSPKLGRCFFEGVINTHYFGRVLGKFKTISEFYKKAVVDDASEKDKRNIISAETFQAFVFWGMRLLCRTQLSMSKFGRKKKMQVKLNRFLFSM